MLQQFLIQPEAIQANIFQAQAYSIYILKTCGFIQPYCRKILLIHVQPQRPDAPHRPKPGRKVQQFPSCSPSALSRSDGESMDDQHLRFVQDRLPASHSRTAG